MWHGRLFRRQRSQGWGCCEEDSGGRMQRIFCLRHASQAASGTGRERRSRSVDAADSDESDGGAIADQVMCHAVQYHVMLRSYHIASYHGHRVERWERSECAGRERICQMKGAEIPLTSRSTGLRGEEDDGGEVLRPRNHAGARCGGCKGDSGTAGRMSVFPRKPLAVAIAIARVRSRQCSMF